MTKTSDSSKNYRFAITSEQRTLVTRTIKANAILVIGRKDERQWTVSLARTAKFDLKFALNVDPRA